MTLKRIVEQSVRQASWFGRKASSQAGLFGKQISTPGDFERETQTAIGDISDHVNYAVNADVSNVVEAVDSLSNRICLTADLSDCIRSIHPDANIADAADQCHQKLGGYVEELNSSAELHRPLKAFCDSDLITSVDEDTFRCATLLLHDFEQSGINLPEHERREYVELHADIIEKQSYLAQMARQPSVFDKSTLDPKLVAALLSQRVGEEHNVQGRNLIVQYSWLMRHMDRDIRKQSYLNYYRLDDLTANNQALFTNRRKMAQALGFDSFSHRALMLSAPKGPAEVGYFLRSLSEEMNPYLQNDRQFMSQHLVDSSPPGPWDIYSIANLTTKQLPIKLNFYDCLNGFFTLAESLFGIHFEKHTPQDGEVWHTSVLKFNVIHQQTGTDYGTIYVDPFTRQDKRCMDCHFTVQCGKQLPDKYQNPIIVVSFSCQNRGQASEISHDELTTMFHEMGHAVHSILARTRYQHLFGTRISTDFAEVPSTLFERFATVPAVLRLCNARNRDTGELLELTDTEAELLRHSARNSSNIPAIELQNTIFTALCDLELHGPVNEEITRTIERVAMEHAPFEADGTSGWWNRFSHFAIYGAKYYSYLWAQAVAGRIWTQLFESDPLSREAGMTLYNGFLKHGNGLSPAQMYQNCTQEEMNPTLLIDEIIQQFKTSTTERYN